MIAVIGAGLSGATIARLYADAGYRVTVYEQREQVGGMARDHVNEAGILVPDCGPHFFHTNDEAVWKFVQRFATWKPYELRILLLTEGVHVPVPPNNTTVDMIGCNYEARIFDGYTRKQWGEDAEEVAAAVRARVMFRNGYDDRYFTDKYQAVPAGGYTALVENMLAHENIKVVNIEWKDDPYSNFSRLFYTGRIDHAVGGLAFLDYRCLRFEHLTLPLDTYQQRAVINFPGSEPWTRITEPKHYNGGPLGTTTIIREYPGDEGEPCYPVPTERNKALYAQYQERAKEMEADGIYFVGRLATYKYLNMDEAIRAAMDLFERVA